MTEKTTKTAAEKALPEIGYYTDADGYAWQLTAAEAAKLGYTEPDPQQGDAPKRPAGPPPAEAATA